MSVLQINLSFDDRALVVNLPFLRLLPDWTAEANIVHAAPDVTT